jgi:hypothetical protein
MQQTLHCSDLVMNPPGRIHKAENTKKNHDSALASTSLVSEQYDAKTAKGERMWDHLSVTERARRVSILESAVVHGGLSGDYYSPSSILGVWAYHSGDQEQALKYWGFSQWECESPDPFDPRTPQSDVDLESGEFNLLTPPEALFQVWTEGPDLDGLAEHPLLPLEAFQSVPELHEASGRVGSTNYSGNPFLLMIARNSAIDEETYEWLWLQVPAAFDWTDLATALIGNPATPTERLQAVKPLDDDWLRTYSAHDEDSYIRDFHIAQNVAYASHPGLPLQNLVALAQDINPEVRSAVATTTRTPMDVLMTLAMDASQEVRSAVKENPNATDEIKSLTALR